jgi:hypothetical protein
MWKTQTKFNAEEKAKRRQLTQCYQHYLQCDVKILAQLQHVTVRRRLTVESQSASSVVIHKSDVKNFPDDGGDGGGGKKERQPTKPRRIRQIEGIESNLASTN